MRATFFIPVFAAAVLAQDSSSTGDAFPQTTFLQQTNSLGVVTGQPSVVTSQPSVPAADSSQPAVATSVGLPASIPAVSSGLNTVLIPGTAGPNSTATLTVSANNSTTVVVPATSRASGASGSGASGTGADATGTGADATGSDASQTGSSGTAQSTGAAATMKAVAGSVVGVGAFMAAFL